MDTTSNSYSTLAIAAGVGFILALGRVLAADEHVSAKKALGRAIISSVLAMAGFAILTFIPALGLEGKVGVAALMSSLGTTGAEMLFRRIVGAKMSDQPEDKP